jgi:hypothetical protein
MSFVRAVLLAATTAILASCTQTEPITWFKQGATDAERDRDLSECEAIGAQQAQSRYSTPTNYLLDVGRYKSKCMHLRGWQELGYPGG